MTRIGGEVMLMVMGGAIRVGSGIGLRSPERAGLDTSNLAVGLQRRYVYA